MRTASAPTSLARTFRGTLAALSASIGVVLIWALATHAQESTGAALVRSLNSQALDLDAQLTGASSSASAAAAARARANDVLRRRLDALSALIAQDPSEALRLAFSPDLLSDLADVFPSAQQQLETHGTWEGRIEYIIRDDEGFRSHRNIRAMTVGSDTVYVEFAGSERPGSRMATYFE
jgi:hypothetical protein